MAQINGCHIINDSVKNSKPNVVENGIQNVIQSSTSVINPNVYADVEKLANFVRSKIHHKPTLGIICGSGLGKIVDLIEKPDILPYENIPGFPVSTVHGHSGNFVFGLLKGKTVVCMQGRIHTYEGYSTTLCTLPIRLMRLLGVETMIVTNAAGGLHSTYVPGDIMLIKDHICLLGFAGRSPLCGVNDERFGPRFPTMANAYDKGLRKIAKDVAAEIGMTLHEGVYAMTGGPQFETPAECRALSLMGADVIGMSTAHEVIVARHCGIKVIGLTLITNVSELETDHAASECDVDVHKEVLKTGEESVNKASNFVTRLIQRL